MSVEIPPVVKQDVRKIFFTVNNLTVSMNKNLPWVNLTFFGDVWVQFVVWPRWCLSKTYVLSREKNYLQPCLSQFKKLGQTLPCTHTGHVCHQALLYHQLSWDSQMKNQTSCRLFLFLNIWANNKIEKKKYSTVSQLFGYNVTFIAINQLIV